MTAHPAAPDSNTSAQAQADRTRIRWAVALIALAAIAGSSALALLCMAMGLGFDSEGWGTERGELSRSDFIWLGIAMALATVAIVSFWVGLFRLSQPASEIRQEPPAGASRGDR